MLNISSLKRKKEHVSCPIHGTIEVFDYEMTAIDHKMVQKLRHVHQNDVLQYVFIGATHTRLSHSIGAMHIAGEAVSKIFESKYNDFLDTCSEVDLNNWNASKYLMGVSYLTAIIRLAALFHDLGHAAFSHQLEKTNCLQYILKDESTFKSLWDGIYTADFYSDLPNHVEHEHYSVRSAYEVLNDLNIESLGLERTDILNIMDTTDGTPSNSFVEASKAVWDVLSSKSVGDPNDFFMSDMEKAKAIMSILRTLISGELDIDKMDYLLRDSYYCGVKYGQFGLSTLLKSLSVCLDNDNKWFGLVIYEKSLDMAESIIQSRFNMFNNVYNHKTSNGFELLLNLAISEIMSIDETKLEVEQCFKDISYFVNLTDDFLWQKFKVYAHKNPGSYCDMLISRKRLKYLGSYDITSEPNFDVDKTLSDIKKNASCDAMYRVIKTKFSSIDSDFTDIKVLKKNPIDGSRKVLKISDVTSFFERNKSKKSVFYHMI